MLESSTCFRIRDSKTFLTGISCDEHTCCYTDRIFNYSPAAPEPTATECQELWSGCLGNISQVSDGDDNLTAADQIWLIVIVFCVLILIVISVITFFLYKLYKNRRAPRTEKSIQTQRTDSSYSSEKRSVVLQLESAEPSPQLVHAAQIFVTNAVARPTTREREPLDLQEKLSGLIKSRDEEKLAAFLETISEFYEGDIAKETVDDAREVLKAWKMEGELQRFCCHESLQPMNSWQLTKMKNTVQDAEQSPHRNQINSIYIKQAKQTIAAETARHTIVGDLKTRMSSAMKDNDLTELESLVDIIRAKQLDGSFEQELRYAQSQFEGQQKKAVNEMKEDLVDAVRSRDSATLRNAIYKAERSSFRGEVELELGDAKQALLNLEEEVKLLASHRMKIANSIASGDIGRMEDTLALYGQRDDLRREVGDLEMELKKKYLQRRLRGNLNVAVQFIQGLDLVRLRRALNEATAAGFLKELGVELDQSDGLISKLERMELIKKSVMDLTNGHIAEIKSYSAPPVQVHKVLMSLLIVLGESPDVVRDWREIQVILVKTGKMSLKRRVQDYIPDNLSQGNATRAANIISDITADELHGISRAAKVFYLWTSAVVEDKLSRDVAAIE